MKIPHKKRDKKRARNRKSAAREGKPTFLESIKKFTQFRRASFEAIIIFLRLETNNLKIHVKENCLSQRLKIRVSQIRQHALVRLSDTIGHNRHRYLEMKRKLRKKGYYESAESFLQKFSLGR